MDLVRQVIIVSIIPMLLDLSTMIHRMTQLILVTQKQFLFTHPSNIS